MKILFIGKFPPIQGGVSSSSLTLIRDLNNLGHEVLVLTNANEVEQGFRQNLTENDWHHINEYVGQNVKIFGSSSNQNPLHIPFSKCYFEKLSGLGVEILENNKVDLIICWYFQPYLQVAAYLSTLFSIPYVANHAGSDLGRLSKESHFRNIFSKSLERCEMIFTRRNSINLLRETFPEISDSQIRVIKKGNKLPKIFNVKAYAVSLRDEILEARTIFSKNKFYSNESSILAAINDGFPNNETPTLGMYGKIGKSKGSFAIIEALNELVNNDVDFNFIYIAGGTKATFNEFVKKLNDFPKLISKVWIIPYVSYIKVPNFIKAFDITLFLENGFSIDIHNPTIPFEILAIGSCLITTDEITKKTVLDTLLINHKNYMRVKDPNIATDLASTIEYALQDKRFKIIGAHGRSVHQVVQSDKEQFHPIALEIEKEFNRT